jgi:hypothetical protein
MKRKACVELQAACEVVYSEGRDNLTNSNERRLQAPAETLKGEFPTPEKLTLQTHPLLVLTADAWDLLCVPS